MTGDTLIIEETAAGHKATAIPAELREIAEINRQSEANGQAAEQSRIEKSQEQQRRRRQEDAELEKMAEAFRTVFIGVSGYIITGSVLAILVHFRLLDSRVAWAAFSACSFWLGWQVKSNT